MATITVDQQKLVLNAFAATFQNNLLAKDLVTWKKYDTEMDDKNGLKVSEQVGPRYNVTRTTSGVNDLTSGVQDSVFGSEQFTVQDVFGSSMGWGDFVKIRDIGEARESVALANAATNMAEQIDAYILKVAQYACNNEVGTVAAASQVKTLGDVLKAYTRAKKEGIPDANLKLVLPYDDKEALANTLVAYPAAPDLGQAAFRSGFEGSIGGIPTMFTQQLSTITTGTRTATAAVVGAGQNVNYATVAVSGAPGQYLSQTLNINGLGAGGTIADGETFTINGVFAYDNRKQQALTHLQQFRVIGAATADGTGAATVRIFPAIVIPNGGANTAHATVSVAPGAGAVITFAAAASTTYMPRIMLDKNLIQVNTADLIMPATGTAQRKQLTQLPVSIRMWQDSSFNTGDHRVRFDVALTANVRDRRYGVRVCGS
jgi:hypothetical protein